tara:strand:+ start:1997 stop:2911 length:915 start_codon:yes stop_codon:yes gene_type:complete
MTQQQLGRKVAILSTSDIMRRDNQGNFLSTGLLEHAQDVMKLRVIIVSTREKTFEHDTWWIIRLDKEDIYMSPPPQHLEYGADTHAAASRRALRRAWFPLLKKLGWEYPPCEHDETRERDHNQMPFWAGHTLKTLHRYDIKENHSHWLEDQMKFHIEVRNPDVRHPNNPSLEYITFIDMADMVYAENGLDSDTPWCSDVEIKVFVRNEVTVDIISKDGEGGATHTRETFEIKGGHYWDGAKDYPSFEKEMANFFDSEILERFNTSKHWSETISVTAMTDIDDELFCTTVITILENTATSHTELV